MLSYFGIYLVFLVDWSFLTFVHDKSKDKTQTTLKIKLEAGHMSKANINMVVFKNDQTPKGAAT